MDREELIGLNLRLNFGSRPLLVPDLGIIRIIFDIVRSGTCTQFGSDLWKNWSDLYDNFYQKCIFQQSPVNYGRHPESGPESSW